MTPMPPPLEVAIRGETIRLGQLLKLAGIVDDGAGAKRLLAGQPALVNGQPDARRGRQLHPGDIVQVGDARIGVVAGAGTGDAAPDP